MKHRASKLVFFLASVTVFACSSQSGEEDGSEYATVGNADTVTLAEVDVGYGSIEFYKTTSRDGVVAYGVLESASAYATSTPFGDTMRGRPHTMLELFKAVAPDRTPPAELVTNHPLEAERLERATDAVEPAVFDRDAPVEKAVQPCIDHIWEPVACYEWTNKLELTTTGGNWLPVGNDLGDFSHMTMGSVTMGVCNATSTPTRAHFLFNMDASSPYYNWRAVRDLPAWTQLRDWNVTNSYYTCASWSAGQCQALISHPARYAVTHDPGAGATLMSAELSGIGCPIL